MIDCVLHTTANGIKSLGELQGLTEGHITKLELNIGEEMRIKELLSSLRSSRCKRLFAGRVHASSSKPGCRSKGKLNGDCTFVL